MARTNNLTNFLTDVATAIKSKTGKSTSIPAANFDTEIMTIETGGTYQSKTITISANGDQTITPDQGYDAIDQIVIQTRVPIKTLQVKSMQITSNMNVEIEPDSGYDGFSKLNLEVNVPSSTSDATAQAQDILRGKTAYIATGKATGTFYGAKLFETTNAMNADQNKRENDLAVIYNDIPVYLQLGDKSKRFIFPEEITIDHAYDDSDNNMIIIRSTDDNESLMLDIEFQGSVCYAMGYFPDGQVWIDYNQDSNNPLLYHREHFDIATTYATIQDEYLVFTLPMTIDDNGQSMGNYTNAARFLCTSRHQYNGIFIGTKTANPNVISVVKDWTANNGQNIIREDVAINRTALENFAQILIDDYNCTQGFMTWTDTDITFYNLSNTWACKYNDVCYWVHGNCYSSSNTPITVTSYTYNITTETITTDSVTSTAVQTPGMSGNYYMHLLLPLTNLNWTAITLSNLDISGSPTDSGDTYYHEKMNLWLSTGGSTDIKISYAYNVIQYQGAETQFTLDNANQLLPGFTALGADNIYTGDGSIYNNLDTKLLRSNVMNIDTTNLKQVCKLYSNTDFSKQKLYGYRFDNLGIYGEACLNYWTRYTANISQATYNSLYSNGYSCYYNNQLYVFVSSNTSSTYARGVIIFDIVDNQLVYNNYIQWTDSLSKYVTNSFVMQEGTKVYIALNKNYGSGGTYIELQIFDLTTNTIQKMGYKQLTTSSVYGCATSRIDVANTCIYCSNYTSGSSSTNYYYRWNWTTNTSTRIYNYSYNHTSYVNKTMHATYDYDCTTTTNTNDTIKIINRLTDSIATTITVPSTTNAPGWIVLGDIAYIMSDKYVCKIDLTNLTYTINNINITSSPKNIYSTNRSVWIDNDDVWFISNNSSYGNTAIGFNLYKLNTTNLSLTYYPIVDNTYGIPSMYIDNNVLRIMMLQYSNSSTWSGAYSNAIIKFGSIDDFNKCSIGLLFNSKDYNNYNYFYLSSLIADINDILYLPKANIGGE